jgi:deoxyribonuclease-2
MPLSAMDDNGHPVDWWFMYKVAGKGKKTDGSKPTGTEYVYFDAHTPGTGKLVLSPDLVNNTNKGALSNTLNQLYGSAGNNSLGWFFYNDENPITGQVVGARGHTKGVLAFDLGDKSAFWLVQSTPKFPPQKTYSFPNTGMPNAQTLLCIALKDADTARTIANQMYYAQQPNVYLASNIPTGLPAKPAPDSPTGIPTKDEDRRAQLIQNKVANITTAVHGIVPFKSKAGVDFTAMAKNKIWGLDFYNDLVGPTLHENVEVETWEHDPTPQPEDSDKIHHVVDMKAVDLTKIGIPFEWPEPDDHAKLCISDLKEAVHYVCVGDINFTLAQRKRGGGTVAFKCEPLWKSLSACLVGVTKFPRANATEALPAELTRNEPGKPQIHGKATTSAKAAKPKKTKRAKPATKGRKTAKKKTAKKKAAKKKTKR